MQKNDLCIRAVVEFFALWVALMKISVRMHG